MKKHVKLFVSYASANRDLAGRFLEKFQEQAAPSKRYRYTLWRDSAILVGELWHKSIQNALSECDAGLLLVSPAFLASRYIDEHELPRFVGGSAKPVVLVMLQPVDFDRHDLKGLQDHEIFRLDIQRSRSRKSYYECSSQQRFAFARELFVQVESRLDLLTESPA